MENHRKFGLGAAGIALEIICAAALALGAPTAIWVVLLLVGLAFLGIAIVGEPAESSPEPARATQQAGAGDGDGDFRGNIFGNNATITVTTTGELHDVERKVMSCTASDLMQIYRNHTALQAKSLAEPYLGGWLRIEGRIYNVDQWDDGRFHISIHSSEEVASDGLIFLIFEEDHQEDIRRLRKHDEIAVLGRLASADTYDISLNDCELAT